MRANGPLMGTLRLGRLQRIEPPRRSRDAKILLGATPTPLKQKTLAGLPGALGAVAIWSPFRFAARPLGGRCPLKAALKPRMLARVPIR
jgi:hypothetical protein